MSIAEDEALATLRILVAIARADGSIHTDERKSLAAALESLGGDVALPGGLATDRLLDETIDLDAELAVLTSPDAREQIYRSAYFMAFADGSCSKEEQAILDRIAVATEPSAETLAQLERMFVGRARGGEPSSLQAVDDPDLRAA